MVAPLSASWQTERCVHYLEARQRQKAARGLQARSKLSLLGGISSKTHSEENGDTQSRGTDGDGNMNLNMKEKKRSLGAK